MPNTRGTTAKKAAGKVHTDMEHGFIRAETYNFEELARHGSEKTLAEKGLIRTDGRDYIVADGDILKILFQKS